MTVTGPGQRKEPDEPTREHLLEWLEACVTEGRGLNSWEEGFLASMDDKLGRGWELSPKEQRILERIYTEKVP